MGNLLAVNGYQFNYTINPDVVDVIGVVDGTFAMTGGAAGLVAQLGNGLVMGYDGTMSGASIPSGYPGNPSGNEGNLLAVLFLSPQYSGSADDIAVTISDFVVSGVNPFTGESVTLNACDMDCIDGTFDEYDENGLPNPDYDPDPLACIGNGCFDTDTFTAPSINCAGLVSTHPAYEYYITDCVGTCITADYTSWIGDGYCDDGSWGINFVCEEYGFDAVIVMMIVVCL
jgi:hypothetical protein